jgi:[acyl-carrier-protein] S-malonyltransferase
MLADMAAARPGIIDTFAEASGALRYDLWSLVQKGPEEHLNQTRYTQPALLSAGVALWRIWEAEGGPRPVVMAGHSLGEYTALVCSNALDFADAVILVAERGRLMQEAVPTGQGAMAAVLGLEDEMVRAVCAEASQGEVLAAANYNAPGQVVIAGTAAAVERGVALAKEKGAKRALILPVSVPSHCELMRPAAEKLADYLKKITLRRPAIPVIHNVDVVVHDSPEQIRSVLVQQLYSPVRWVETIQAMAERGVTTTIECGPGKVLAGLNKRIVKQMTALPLFDEASLNGVLASVKGEK